MKRLLKSIAPKAFNDGLLRCNEFGKKLVTKRKIDRFLDIGCGDGTFSLEFANLVNTREIHGIEFIDEYQKQAIEKGIKCIKCDLNAKWPFKNNSFDLILSSQSIEHLHNTRIFLEECYRCLKKNGQVIILTENIASWINILATVFGWQPFSTYNINGFYLGNPFIWHIDEPKDEEFLKKWQDTGVSGTVGHVRVLAYRGLKDLLKEVGFSNVTVHTRGYLPFWGALSDLLCVIDKRHGHFLIATATKK